MQVKYSLQKVKNFFNLLQKFRQRLYANLAHNVIESKFDKSTLIHEGYYSQCGQDKWIIEELITNYRNGIFVDIGAHDGISFSNTYYLEKVMGWDGIAIEPIPDIFEKLSRNRKCQVINGCIAAKSGLSEFLRINGYSEMLSGLVNQYDNRHLQRIQKEIEKHGGSSEILTIPCYSLNELLHKYQISHIDYLSIDVEGSELEILKSIDFDRFTIAVIGCENNYKDYRIPQFLIEQGYQFHSIVGDEFYIKS